MRQLLESLHKVNVAQAAGQTFFESHIIFDNGVSRSKLTDFALVLISLLEETLGNSFINHCSMFVSMHLCLNFFLAIMAIPLMLWHSNFVKRFLL